MQVDSDNGHLGGTFGTAAGDEGILGQLEVGFSLRHVVEEFLIGVQGVDELIVLGDDVGTVVEVSVLVSAVGVVAAGTVGKAALFTHLLEDNGIHRAAEVFVEELYFG